MARSKAQPAAERLETIEKLNAAWRVKDLGFVPMPYSDLEFLIGTTRAALNALDKLTGIIAEVAAEAAADDAMDKGKQER